MGSPQRSKEPIKRGKEDFGFMADFKPTLRKQRRRVLGILRTTRRWATFLNTWEKSHSPNSTTRSCWQASRLNLVRNAWSALESGE